MIYLMRHGEDDPARLGGWSDAGLTAAGVKQAEEAAGRLARSGCPIRRVYASDLPRAKETAEIVARHLGMEVTLLAAFRETDNGDLAGLPRERFLAEYPGLYWSTLAWDQPYPNGESPGRFFGRIREAWTAFRREADALSGDTLLVTHAGVIDVIRCLESGVPWTNRFMTHRTACAEIVPAGRADHGAAESP